MYAGPFHVDHVVSTQHGGETALDNLALARGDCNRRKGPNIAGRDPATGEIVRLFHEELAPLVGRELATANDPRPSELAPRLRQTLRCLLEGDSEKQIAARLHLSGGTVHQYVTGLYRYFRVSSRAELMAYFLRRRWPVLPAQDGIE